MKAAMALLGLGLLATAGCAATPRPSSATVTLGAATAGPTVVPGSAAPSTGAPVSSAAPTASSTPVASASPEPVDSGGSTTGGDIPDNAVFLTYTDAAHGFSIVYVEGWQVTPTTDGVGIRDKDSSETVQIVPSVTDIPGYISSTDLPQLQALPGFTLDTQDMVGVNGQQINHIVYHAPSPPDQVTGKEVASTIDRYYVSGANGQLAVVTLSTPDGVDNVDAFREMIKSFAWS